MSLDRFVRWQTELRPTREELQLVLEDYLGGAGEARWDTDRFFVTLTGLRSEAYRRCAHVTEVVRAYAEHTLREPPANRIRWIELYLHEDSIDVITRCADDFTNAVAERLAEICAAYWDGKVDGG